jgi:hypothetical protein
MIPNFEEVTNSTEPGRKSAVRALQAWQYLIGKAANRQLVKYEELANLMEYPTNNPLNPALAHIMYFCQQNELPPLTIIAVGKNGLPGEGLIVVKKEEIPQKREEVFNFPWYKYVPPTIDEFQKAKKTS